MDGGKLGRRANRGRLRGEYRAEGGGCQGDFQMGLNGVRGR